jgi:hypothetical protein
MYGSVLGTGEAVGRAMRPKSKRLKRSDILIFSGESLRSLLLLLALQHKEGSEAACTLASDERRALSVIRNNSNIQF